MSFINNVLSRINMAEFLAMISKWWTCIIDSACALYILKKSRINIVRLFWIRAQSYVGILKMYCTFVFGLCIINPVTSMDHSTFEKCTCIINPACPFCHLHHFWRNLVPPVCFAPNKGLVLRPLGNRTLLRGVVWNVLPDSFARYYRCVDSICLTGFFIQQILLSATSHSHSHFSKFFRRGARQRSWMKG